MGAKALLLFDLQVSRSAAHETVHQAMWSAWISHSVLCISISQDLVSTQAHELVQSMCLYFLSVLFLF